VSNFWECTLCGHSGELLHECPGIGDGAISGVHGGAYPTPAQHDEMMLRGLHGRLRALDEHPAVVPLEELVDAAVSRRLRAIVERLRVSHGGLVPDAEVYVRETLAKAIEEGLEER
jgi:hypothetical protein